MEITIIYAKIARYKMLNIKVIPKSKELSFIKKSPR
jgi:hypothetical protein